MVPALRHRCIRLSPSVDNELCLCPINAVIHEIDGSKNPNLNAICNGISKLGLTERDCALIVLSSDEWDKDDIDRVTPEELKKSRHRLMTIVQGW